EEFRIGAQRDIPETAVTAHAINRHHRVRNRVVLKSLSLTDDENVFQVNCMAMRRRRDRGIHGSVLGQGETIESQERENKKKCDSSATQRLFLSLRRLAD